MPKRTLRLYQPHSLQFQGHESMARYRVLAWGRQSGKSTWGNNESLKAAWRNKGHVYWYILPTWAQALIQFRRALNSMRPCPAALTAYSMTELSLTLRSGSTIFYKSGKNFEDLRAETLSGVIIDEYREQHPDMWPRVIRPMLTTTGGWAAFTSTTNGFDEFYELAARAKQDQSGKWGYFQAPSTCNPLFTQAELEECRETMSNAEFRQEIMAEFVELTVGKVYPNYTQANILDTNPFSKSDRPSRHLPILLCPDFNLSPMGWPIGQQLGHDFYWMDEIFDEHTDTANAAKKFVEKYRAHEWTTPVAICGDATANAGQRAAGGKSDYDILKQVLREAGIEFSDKTPESNPPIKDRVNAVNARLKNANGEVHMWHHSKCVKIGRDFMRTKWKESKGLEIDPGVKRDLGHITDGLGYGVHKLAPVPPVNKPGSLRVIAARS